MDRRGEVVVIYCGRRPQPSLEVWVGQVGVVGYEPFYVWVIVELRRSIPKGTVVGRASSTDAACAFFEHQTDGILKRFSPSFLCEDGCSLSFWFSQLMVVVSNRRHY